MEVVIEIKYLEVVIDITYLVVVVEINSLVIVVIGKVTKIIVKEPFEPCE